MPNVAPDASAPAWFAARKEIGVRELPENRGRDIRHYIALAHCGGEGDPWCAIFANAMLEGRLALGGCADDLAKIQTTVSNAIGVIGKIDSKSAYIAINAFNAAEQAATAHLRPPRCQFNGAAEALENPFNAGIDARNDLRAWMKAYPGSLANAGLYMTLKAATCTLQKVMADYGVSSSGGPDSNRSSDQNHQRHSRNRKAKNCWDVKLLSVALILGLTK